MYVFLSFGGFEAQEAIIIIGVWVAECAYFSRLEALSHTKPYNYMGLGRCMCVFLVFGDPQTHEASIIIGVWVAECTYFLCLEVRRPSHARSHCINRGLGRGMCVFLVLGGPQAHEATIIIGVWVAECAYFSCLEALGRTTLL